MLQAEPKYSTLTPDRMDTKQLQRFSLKDRDGNLLVDFVGRFESLGEDLAYICQRLGITASLPHINRSRHQDYRHYYDDRTANLVASHFREDIQRLGYIFDERQGVRKAA